ncbi:unnamed protein product, partial [Brassica rapa subsp. trilocularis]
YYYFSLEHKEFLIIGGRERGLNLIIILFWSTIFSSPLRSSSSPP